jgi:hypothetical protein
MLVVFLLRKLQFLDNNIIVGYDWSVCFENKPGASGFVNNFKNIDIKKKVVKI